MQDEKPCTSFIRIECENNRKVRIHLLRISNIILGFLFQIILNWVLL